MRARNFALVALLTTAMNTALAGVVEGVEAYQKFDFKTAFNEWQPLAEQGDPVAQLYLGNMYEYGNGAVADIQVALKWYLLSAQQGYSPAQIKVGNLYATGTGVKQDNQQALEWFRRCAAQGSTSGIYHLGLMYRRGQGVPQNYVVAYALFQRSVQRTGDPGSVARSEISMSMTVPQKEEAGRLGDEMNVDTLKALDAYLALKSAGS